MPDQSPSTSGVPGRARIASRKWDGGPHRDNEADDLGEDEHGRWLWMPDRTPVDGPAGIWFARAGLRRFPPGRQWWSAFFVPASPDRPRQLYVDITTPAEITAHRIEFVDLDLDVQILGDGPPVVLDRDEFDAHRAEWCYPEPVVAAAERTVNEIMTVMSGPAEPFGSVWQNWLRVARTRYPE